MNSPVSSEFIQEQRKEYALYVLSSRALPAISDGLVAAGRRNIWKARSGKLYKTETLAGITMSLHPHANSSDAINTLASYYGNNIPLFAGKGAFGTRLEKNAYGAPRYTSVELSKFTKDVMLVDTELIPMVDNYDHTEKEPLHLLPLVPVSLINPFDGIAVGFASRILPRSLEDIINCQLLYLNGKEIDDDMLIPHFIPTDSKASFSKPTPKGKTWYFNSKFDRISASEIHITDLPYGARHADVISKLDKLWDEGFIHSYVDNSAKTVDVTVKFGRGKLKDITDAQIINKMGLQGKESEILYILTEDSQGVLHISPSEIIKRFTDWRLDWYETRYELQRKDEFDELTKWKDIKTAIDNNVGQLARSVSSRKELITALKGMNIVNLDYIADLGVYRFTKEEYAKNEKRIKESEDKLKTLQEFLDDPEKRIKQYVTELKAVLREYKKGSYDSPVWTK